MTLPNLIKASCTYDNASQVVGIVCTKPDASLLGDLRYSYDAAGRRIVSSGSLARVSLPQAVSPAVYDQANRLTKLNVQAMTYDANGNLTSDGVRNYGWDARNRLASMTGTAPGSFRYDAFGRRVGKTINGVQTGFLYDGGNPVQELAGTTPVANLLPGLGIDEYFRLSDAPGPRDLLTDALGSTVALADASAL